MIKKKLIDIEMSVTFLPTRKVNILYLNYNVHILKIKKSDI